MLAKNNLNTIKVLISQVLSDSYISNGEFILVNYVLREYHEMKEEIRNPKSIVKYTMEMYSVTCKRNTENKNSSIIRTK